MAMSQLNFEDNGGFSGLEISDLMMALVAVFLLGSVLMRDAAGKYSDAETLNREQLDRVMAKSLGPITKKYGIELLAGGTLRFRGGFEQGKSILRPEMKKQLDELCPALKEMVIERKSMIKAVVFEGHTNTDWTAVDVNTPYYGNKDVSDERAINTMKHCLGKDFESTHPRLMSKFMAIGYSYTKPYRDSKGRIVWSKSKRVDIVVLEEGVELE